MKYLNTFASNLIMSDPSVLLDFFVKASANIADRSAPVLAQIVGHRLGQHLVHEHLRPLLLPPQLPGLR